MRLGKCIYIPVLSAAGPPGSSSGQAARPPGFSAGKIGQVGAFGGGGPGGSSGGFLGPQPPPPPPPPPPPLPPPGGGQSFDLMWWKREDGKPHGVVYEAVRELGRAVSEFYLQFWTALDGKLDGYNFKAGAFGDGLVFTEQTRDAGKILHNSLAKTDTRAYIRKKAATGTRVGREPGLEFLMDPSVATYGQACFVDYLTPTVQRLSVILDNPASGGSPGAEVKTPTGALTLNTGGAFNLIVKRNGVLQQTFNGTSILGAVTYSSPGAGANSERYGASAVAAGASATAIGNGASAPTGQSVAVGYQSVTSGTGDNVAVGSAANAADAATVVGSSSGAGANGTVVGQGATISANRIGYGKAATDLSVSTIPKVSSAGSKLEDSAITDNGTTVTSSRATDWSAASSTLGDLRTTRSTQTAAHLGSYSVAATIATVFVACAALTAAQNFTVTLPSAVTYAGRIISVKVTTVGAATSTLTIGSAAGNVDGAATQVEDAAVRIGVTLQSDGTDWFYLSTFLILA